MYYLFVARYLSKKSNAKTNIWLDLLLIHLHPNFLDSDKSFCISFLSSASSEVVVCFRRTYMATKNYVIFAAITWKSNYENESQIPSKCFFNSPKNSGYDCTINFYWLHIYFHIHFTSVLSYCIISSAL